MSGHLPDYVRLFTLRFNVLMDSLIFIKPWNHKNRAHILENIKQFTNHNLKSFDVNQLTLHEKNHLKPNHSEVC